MSAKKLLTSRAIIGEFYNRLENGPLGWVTRIAMKIKSTQESESYAWLGMTPTMREWIGGRLAKDLRENSFDLRNKPHESTLEISVDDLRRDSSGQILIRIGEMADRANAYPAKLLSSLIVNGESTLCYDGQYFFDTDHAEGDSGAQSNDIPVDISELPVSSHGTTAAPSTAEMQKAILAGAQAILGFKDDQGEPMSENATEFDVMVPTPLWSVAIAAVKLPVIDGGDSNLIPAGTLKFNVIVNPRLSWTTKFAVVRADGQTKPFILQEEVPVEMSAVAEGSELEFKHRKHWYGAFWSGNVGYGYWQHACLVTLT